MLSGGCLLFLVTREPRSLCGYSRHTARGLSQPIRPGGCGCIEHGDLLLRVGKTQMDVRKNCDVTAPGTGHIYRVFCAGNHETAMSHRARTCLSWNATEYRH
jgi:hypothetical protein